MYLSAAVKGSRLRGENSPSVPDHFFFDYGKEKIIQK
jgi:hypothetical protein